MDLEALKQARDWGLLKELTGKEFCLTGKISVKRDDLTALISTLGGRVHSAVVGTTDYLIVPVGDEFRKGSKYNAAQSRGVTIIDEEEFCEMILPTVEELTVKN